MGRTRPRQPAAPVVDGLMRDARPPRYLPIRQAGTISERGNHCGLAVGVGAVRGSGAVEYRSRFGRIVDIVSGLGRLAMFAIQIAEDGKICLQPVGLFVLALLRVDPLAFPFIALEGEPGLQVIPRRNRTGL